ncbi:hypothetical protein HDU97_001061 [Phlyctochytrium planicorne]|nr:hypothetical protein HDU97_001061 [Phlyctochytrium planicorne]
MGFDLLVHFLSFSRPNFIIQLDAKGANTSSRNIQEDLSAILATFYQERELSFRKTLGFDDDSRFKYNAVDLRTLNYLFYFAQTNSKESFSDLLWDFDEPFLWRTPYEVPMSAVSIAFSSQVPTSQCMYAINGTIVGLGSLDESIPPSEDLIGPARVLSLERLNPQNLNCLGLGIVRAVDVEKGVIYIITPLPPSVLNSVNIILKGSTSEFPVTLALNGFEGYPT